MSMQPLTNAKPGSLLVVGRIDAVGDDAIRLKRMGIYVHGEIQLVQAGDPLIVTVVGARVGISRQLARKILVEPHELAVCEPVTGAERLTA